VKSDDLIASARVLTSSARQSPGRPKQASNRRAVSAAYYAVFHEICEQAANVLVGGEGAERSEKAWRQVYRAINHGPAAQRCKEARNTEHGFPLGITRCANEFIELQAKRHDADYAPEYRVSVADAESLILRAEDAINGLRGCPLKDRRAFCVWLLFAKR